MQRNIAKKNIGCGWHPLINKMYDGIPQTVHVTDVKEKFGGLRVDIDTATLEMLNFIDGIEDESLRVCERCGLEGTLIKNKAGWLKTLCSYHALGESQ